MCAALAQLYPAYFFDKVSSSYASGDWVGNGNCTWSGSKSGNTLVFNTKSTGDAGGSGINTISGLVFLRLYIPAGKKITIKGMIGYQEKQWAIGIWGSTSAASSYPNQTLVNQWGSGAGGTAININNVTVTSGGYLGFGTKTSNSSSTWTFSEFNCKNT